MIDVQGGEGGENHLMWNGASFFFFQRSEGSRSSDCSVYLTERVMRGGTLEGMWGGGERRHD